MCETVESKYGVNPTSEGEPDGALCYEECARRFLDTGNAGHARPRGRNAPNQPGEMREIHPDLACPSATLCIRQKRRRNFRRSKQMELS